MDALDLILTNSLSLIIRSPTKQMLLTILVYNTDNTLNKNKSIKEFVIL